MQIVLINSKGVLLVVGANVAHFFLGIKWLFSNNSFTLPTSLNLPYNECNDLHVVDLPS